MSEVNFISLITLLQHPEKYHQQQIRVIGFAGMEFEHKAVYVSVDDYRNAVTKNAIWLDIELTDQTRVLDQKYVLVEGVFDKNNQGHLRMFSGSATEIVRIEEWSENIQ